MAECLRVENPVKTQKMEGNCFLLTYFAGEVEDQVDEHIRYTIVVKNRTVVKFNQPRSTSLEFKSWRELECPRTDDAMLGG